MSCLWELSGSFLWNTHHSVGSVQGILVLQTMYILFPCNQLLARVNFYLSSLVSFFVINVDLKGAT